MTIVQRGETTVGPVAVDGRTITLVARTRALQLGRGSWQTLHVRARPHHVEVLDADGRREVVRIRDPQAATLGAIAILGAGCALALRLVRKGDTR